MLIGFFDLLQQDLFYLAECGKTMRNQMKIQLFIEFIYSVIYCIQLFLTMSTQSTQSSVYTCCAALRFCTLGGSAEMKGASV